MVYYNTRKKSLRNTERFQGFGIVYCMYIYTLWVYKYILMLKISMPVYLHDRWAFLLYGR